LRFSKSTVHSYAPSTLGKEPQHKTTKADQDAFMYLKAE
jgi:hypothetical protein